MPVPAYDHFWPKLVGGGCKGCTSATRRIETVWVTLVPLERFRGAEAVALFAHLDLFSKVSSGSDRRD